MARTIQSPGVEIKEIDLSLRPELPAGTTILIPGFANSGPTDEIIQVTSISDFEQVYGEPTNSAERYLYHTTKAALNSTGNVNVVRLAYGSGGGTNVTDTYGALMYPVFPLITDPTKLAPISSPLNATTFTSTATAYLAGLSGLEDLDYKDWKSIFASITGNVEYKDADVYFIGEPSTIKVDSQTYRRLIENRLDWGPSVNLSALSANGGGFTSTAGLASGGGIMLLNKKRTAINEKFEGSYIGIIDNAGLNPGSDFNGIQNIKTVTAAYDGTNKEFKTAPTTRFTFGLTAENNGVAGSLSEVMEGLPSFNTATPEFSDTLSIGVFKLKGSTLNPDTTKLDYIFQESFTGSFNYYSKQFPVKGGNPVSFYIEGESQKSDTIKMYVNPYISKESGDWVDAGDEAAKPRKKIRLLPEEDLPDGAGEVGKESNYFLNDDEDKELVAAARAIQDIGYITSPQNLYPIGAFKETVALGDTVAIGNVPNKLNRIFDWADNYELYDFDIILEAGLGTVYAQASANDTGNYFDDEKYLDVSEIQTTKEKTSMPPFVENYRAVLNTFDSFCTVKRKDCIFIADGIRNLMVQGENTKVLEDEAKTFSKNVYWPMRHVFQSFNTSYGAVYANWAKVNDKTLNKNIWVPFSGFAAAAMANTDSNFQPWYAPAGFTRGLVRGALDLAVYPNQKHRDSLYKIGLNPVANFPNDGFVIFGQKTLQAKPSAFDRINVRRMFIYCQKAVRSVMKYFVFEPNTVATRTQVVNVLTPIFDYVQQTEGLYDYMLICDERNNTADVIDRNELIVDVYLKPVRSAEFVLVNFYATRTDQSFAEIIA